MKVSGKGVIVIIVFVILIPIIADLLLSPMVSKSGNSNISMSRVLIDGMIHYLPFYLIYLAIAFTIMYLIKKYKEQKKNKTDK